MMIRVPKVTITILGILVSLSVLSGCASMNAPPSCPDPIGFQCARVDQIDAAMDHHPALKAKHRVNTTSLSVWIAPFTDRHGHYHHASVIDTAKVHEPDHKTRASHHGV